MNKSEQKKYIAEALVELKKAGVSIGWLLSKIGISRTHWYFLKKGERPLTDSVRNKINSIVFEDNPTV